MNDLRQKVTLLTESRYLNPSDHSEYVQNILTEDKLVANALNAAGFIVDRKDWADPEVDWSSCGHLLFRTTWDYFHRFDEFDKWLNETRERAPMINPASLIRWNLDKHYLLDLQSKGVHIVPSHFIEAGTKTTLLDEINKTGWEKLVLKPAISGAGRHTYRIENSADARSPEKTFSELISKESMMLQEFQEHVLSAGEYAFMMIGGEFTHAVRKIAKAGEFRVQDDFGGRVEAYVPSSEEIRFCESVLKACDPMPVYARVDVIIDNEGKWAVSELELIEPEMWFRFQPSAAASLAETVKQHLQAGLLS